MSETDKYGSYRFVIGGLAVWAFISHGLSFQAVSPILPLISEDYDISYTSAGLLVGVVMIVQAVFCIPGGIIAGRFGLWRVYAVSWLVMGAMTFSALHPNFYGLMAMRTVYALGTTALIPATGHLIMQWFPPKERPILTSLKISSSSLGIMVSLATAAPLANIMAWQKVLGLFGAINLAGAFAWIMWGKTQEGAVGAATPLTWREIGGVFRNRTILLLAYADAAGIGYYVAMSSWLPTFYHEGRGMSLTEAGFITSLLPAMGIPSTLVGGFLTLKIESRRPFFIVPGLLMVLGGMGSFLFDDVAITYASVVILGVGCWLYIPMLFSLPMELPGMTPSRVGISWGLIISASGVGMFLAPLLVGALRDASGSFIPGLLAATVLGASVLLVGFLLPETSARKARAPQPTATPVPIQD